MSERRKMTTYRTYLKNQTLPGMSEMETDQMKGLPLPPIQKPHPEGGCLVDLVSPVEFTLGRMPLIDAIRARESRRKYTEEPLSLEELSFLLWATQGVRELVRNGLVTLHLRLPISQSSRGGKARHLSLPGSRAQVVSGGRGRDTKDREDRRDL